MRIAVIGAGQVGGAIGAGWARKGHDVTFGVRDPNATKVGDLLGRTAARAATPRDAARSAEVIALALPWGAAEPVVKALGDLTGKIVIDCMNPLRFTDGELGLDRGYSTSGAEAVASWSPGARVVKTLNQVGYEAMADTSRFSPAPVMFLAGDDADAKAIVAGLVTEFGFEALDSGPLRMARILEPFAMVWIDQALFRGLGREWAFGIVRPRS